MGLAHAIMLKVLPIIPCPPMIPSYYSQISQIYKIKTVGGLYSSDISLFLAKFKAVGNFDSLSSEGTAKS